MARIHKPQRDARYSAAIAAVLFIAVCAYSGAILYEKLSSDMLLVEAEYVTVTQSAELYGIAVRREQLVCSRGHGSLRVKDGSRLAAGDTLVHYPDGSSLITPCAALFLEEYDGLESINPDILSHISPSALSELMSLEPQKSRDAVGKLVEDFAWYYAAFAPVDFLPEPSGQCRLLFSGMSESVPAYLSYVSAPENGQCVLLLRLSCGGTEYMKLRECSAQIIFSQHSGIKLPSAAVHTDQDGNQFVYTLTAGSIEKKAAEIIYREGDFCLAAPSGLYNALRAGDTVIVSGENIASGRISEI